MFDLNKEWSISFAGCGFMGIYYVGAASCIVERFPQFFEKASRIYGASAGSLIATILTIGIPLEKCCLDLMSMAREARKRRLGPLHPAFNLLQIVRDSLSENLPPDAHVRASGKLCVSLTRVADGKNVIVSEFDTREELIQRYVDGAISDNLPRCHLKNTVTFSAFAGESDVCPRRSAALSFHEVRFNNVSIHVNAQNWNRVTSSFFPPEPEIMAEICDSGYLDALRFLQDNGLVPSEGPLAGLALNTVCCDAGNAATEDSGPSERPGLSSGEAGHRWLKQQVIQNLPLDIKRALCEGCREKRDSSSLLSQVTELPGNIASYLRIPRALPVESACTLANRLVDWIPELPYDMGWLHGMIGHPDRPAGREDQGHSDADTPPPGCTSLPSPPVPLKQSGEEFVYPLTPEATPTQSHALDWPTGSPPAVRDDHPLVLTPPPTPTPSQGAAASQAAGWTSGLGRAVDWFRYIGSEKVWPPKPPESQ